MPAAIPPVVAGYIDSCFSSPASTQTLVTSTLDAPPTWLVLRLIAATLYGVEGDLRPGVTPTSERKAGPDSETAVVFVSLIRPFELWAELGRNIGLDVPSLLSSRRLAYVDGLSCGLPSEVGHSPLPSSSSTINPKSLSLNDLNAAVQLALKSLSPSSVTAASSTASSISSVDGSSNSNSLESRVNRPTMTTMTGRTNLPSTTGTSTLRKTTIVLDGLDFLLAAQPGVDAVQVQQLLASLRSSTLQSSNSTSNSNPYHIVVTCAADSPLLHPHSRFGNVNGLENTILPQDIEHSVFVRLMAYQSRFVIQLRPLDTGHAKDISGVLRISKGGADEGDHDNDAEASVRSVGSGVRLVDGEWLYQIKGDGSVRVWGRGEQ